MGWLGALNRLAPDRSHVRAIAEELPCVQVDTVLTIENGGNDILNYSITITEDNGTPGWLATSPDYSGGGGSIPSGLGNTENITIHLNTGGVQNTETELVGRIDFISDDPNNPTKTFNVNFFVVKQGNPSAKSKRI